MLHSPLLDGPEKVKRLIFCSGKVYYDLLKFRDEQKISSAAIIRIEQLYPLDEAQLVAAVKQYPNARAYVWCQEESQNMGAWTFLSWQLRRLFETSLWYAGRAASASPAVGSLGIHKREQKNSSFRIAVYAGVDIARVRFIEEEPCSILSRGRLIDCASRFPHKDAASIATLDCVSAIALQREGVDWLGDGVVCAAPSVENVAGLTVGPQGLKLHGPRNVFRAGRH